MSRHNSYKSFAIQYPIVFGGLMIIILFLLEGIVITIIQYIGFNIPQVNIHALDMRDWFLFMPFLDMPIETLIGQSLPIELLRYKKVEGSFIPIAISAFLFGIVHFPGGPVIVICIMLAGGPVFAYSYWQWRKQSFLYAFIGTTVIHCTRNFITLILECNYPDFP